MAGVTAYGNKTVT